MQFGEAISTKNEKFLETLGELLYEILDEILWMKSLG